jgi:MFS family permease
MIYLTQLLHSVSLGIYLVCAVAYIEQQAPKGLSATAQALLTSSMWGLGAMFGAFGGGILYANAGTPTLFRTASVVTVAALMILLSLRFVKAEH